MRRLNYVLVLTISMILFSCQWGANDPKSINNDIHQVDVLVVIQVSSYTYLNVKEGQKDYWMAVPKTNVNVGEIIMYQGGLEMTDYKSKDLDTTFATIYFVEAIKSISETGAGAMDVKTIHSMMPQIEKVNISLEPVKGVMSIESLFENKQDYNNKKVTVSGLVVKVNSAIMGKNWVHIQDGTDYEGKYDLVLTTNEEIQEGNVLIFDGVLKTDKDFGSGYKYEVIIEEAVVKK